MKITIENKILKNVCVLINNINLKQKVLRDNIIYFTNNF